MDAELTVAPDKRRNVITVVHSKSRDGALSEAAVLRLDVQQLPGDRSSCVIIDARSAPDLGKEGGPGAFERQERLLLGVLAALDGPTARGDWQRASADSWSNTFGRRLASPTFDRVRERLLVRGYVAQEMKKGPYTITNQGRAHYHHHHHQDGSVSDDGGGDHFPSPSSPPLLGGDDGDGPGAAYAGAVA